MYADLKTSGTEPLERDLLNSSVMNGATMSQCVASHPGQLSLAIPSWVGTVSTSQRAVMPCSWE